MIGTDLFQSLKSFSVGSVGSLNGYYDEDTLQRWLGVASYTDSLSVRIPEGGNETMRWGIRSLIALMFDRSIDDAAERIHSLLANDQFTVSDIKHILVGNSNEYTFTELQLIGRMLHDGGTYSHISRMLGHRRQDIARVDSFLGVTMARKDYLIGACIDYLNEGMISNREGFAARTGISLLEAGQVFVEAKKVMRELMI